MTAEQKKEQAEAIASLREWLKPGDTVYTILRHVSRSGMRRFMDVYFIGIAGDKPQPHCISRKVAKICGCGFSKNRDCIIVDGYGSTIASYLSSKLFGTDTGLKQERL